MTPLVAPGLRPGQEIGPVRLIVTCGVGGGGAGDRAGERVIVQRGHRPCREGEEGTIVMRA